jgi:hypothetical protein
VCILPCLPGLVTRPWRGHTSTHSDTVSLGVGYVRREVYRIRYIRNVSALAACFCLVNIKLLNYHIPGRYERDQDHIMYRYPTRSATLAMNRQSGNHVYIADDRGGGGGSRGLEVSTVRMCDPKNK